MQKILDARLRGQSQAPREATSIRRSDEFPGGRGGQVFWKTFLNQ
jgi:hypothetical protein